MPSIDVSPLPTPPLRCDRRPPQRVFADGERLRTRRRPPVRIEPLEPFLLVESGSSLGLVARIGATTLTIGRAPGLGLVLDDDRVSRVHASLRCDARVVKVQDYGSSNGTWLDGRRVLYDTVPHGARLQVGGTVLRIFHGMEEEGAEDARTALAGWAQGRDPLSGLLHGGVLRARLEAGCEARTPLLKLTLLDVPRIEPHACKRLVRLLPPEVRAYRQGDARIALLGIRYGRKLLERVAAVVRPQRIGTATAGDAGYDPSRLLLKAHAALRDVDRDARGGCLPVQKKLSGT